jgi:hypothetical protein
MSRLLFCGVRIEEICWTAWEADCSLRFRGGWGCIFDGYWVWRVFREVASGLRAVAKMSSIDGFEANCSMRPSPVPRFEPDQYCIAHLMKYFQKVGVVVK